jgi:hypothetical protein
MNFDWVLAPVTQAAILGVGLFGSLSIWVSARTETRAVSKALEAKILDLTAQIREMRNQQPSEPAPAPCVFIAGQGLNLTTRTKILRMRRRGETTSSIAAALGVQHEEVDLLLKLDRMLEAG